MVYVSLPEGMDGDRNDWHVGQEMEISKLQWYTGADITSRKKTDMPAKSWKLHVGHGILASNQGTDKTVDQKWWALSTNGFGSKSFLARWTCSGLVILRGAPEHEVRIQNDEKSSL